MHSKDLAANVMETQAAKNVLENEEPDSGPGDFILPYKLTQADAQGQSPLLM